MMLKWEGSRVREGRINSSPVFPWGPLGFTEVKNSEITFQSINQSINQSMNNFIYPRDHFTKKWSSKEPCTLSLNI